MKSLENFSGKLLCRSHEWFHQSTVRPGRLEQLFFRPSLCKKARSAIVPANWFGCLMPLSTPLSSKNSVSEVWCRKRRVGRPSYHPSVLLKSYVYGCLTRMASSRRLEKETQRNVEMMWQTGRLMPDFKTIANFRKENTKAWRGVCREFVVLCRNLDLFSKARCWRQRTNSFPLPILMHDR